jgi:hypothetical protein
MPLLGIKFLPNLNSWDDEAPDPERIADKWFDDPANEQPSLYEATSPIEEVEVVAALSLTNLGRRVEAGYLVRIEWGDLAEVGLRPNNARPGNTGVVAVDFRHWEIPGDRQLIFDLLRHIWHRARRSEDCFRWVGKQMQRAALERLLSADSRLVVEEAKRCCRRKLQGTTGGRRPLGPNLRGELQAMPPTTPEGRIRSLAGERWRQRVRAAMAGTAEWDWLNAEQELRQLYQQQLLGYTPPHGPGVPR